MGLLLPASVNFQFASRFWYRHWAQLAGLRPSQDSSYIHALILLTAFKSDNIISTPPAMRGTV
jgi:hypothetical protein